MKKLFLALASVALGLVAISAQDSNNAPAKRDAAADAVVVKAQLPSYPLDTCAVSDEKLGSMGDPIDLVKDGRLVRLCCKGCTKAVEKDPKDAIAKIDRAVIAQQSKTYPLKKCAVSGEDLGSMGDIIDVVDGTRLVRLCCKGCKKGYAKDPAKFMAKIDAALIESQKKTYPVKKCLVSEEPLDAMGGPIDMLYGTQLVRLCCKGCKKGFEKNPKEFLAKIDAAKKGAAKKDAAPARKG
ncbi:MAG: hypothetical protein AAF682_29370 [Planctomycetota bacterium]